MTTIEIKRILDSTDELIDQLNPLLDEGIVWDPEQGKQFIENETNSLFLAHTNGKVIGFLTAHRLQRFDKRKAEVLLYEITVTPLYRKQGVGKQLMKSLKEWASSMHADEIWVITNKSNRAAVGLYTSLNGSVENQDEIMYTFRV